MEGWKEEVEVGKKGGKGRNKYVFRTLIQRISEGSPGAINLMVPLAVHGNQINLDGEKHENEAFNTEIWRGTRKWEL